jgi:GDP/UDP-N,N'-diacetylbacillosamine 2-epimerase (hydrolysing)
MTRKICYITGTRADFGLMHSTLVAIDRAEGLELAIVVTGMHLVEHYGRTVEDIEATKLPIAARIKVDVEPATGATMARNIGTMLTGFVDTLLTIKPDLVLLLGDRGEMLAGALAAIHLNIPVAHIHGGERSGTVDEPVRHAISKLAHFHFTATEDARNRLVRMGEQPDHVWVTGAPGLDGIESLATAGRTELVNEMGLDPDRPVALLVYHPVLQEEASAGDSTMSILDALRQQNVQVIALKPNSDAGSQRVREALEACGSKTDVRVVTHFSRNRFVSWMAVVNLMVGNSSAGIIEAASFGTPVINVGSRQNLRERNLNVIDVPAERTAIEEAIVRSLASGRYKQGNVYGDGKTADRIVRLLKAAPLNAAVLAKTNAY